MKLKILIAIAACIGSITFFACSPKDLTLQTPVQDGHTGKWGYANAKGEVIISGKYDLAEDFREGFAKVYIGELIHDSYPDGGKFGFINTAGEEVVPCKYDYVRDFQEGLAIVYNGKVTNGSPSGGKFGLIDTAGMEIVPCQYDYMRDFSEGMAAVNIGGKYEPITATIGNETYSHLLVLRGGKWGYIDTTGKEAIAFEYDDAGLFTDGKAMVVVSENGIRKEGYIDRTGTFITPPVEHSFTNYAGEKAIENGQTLVLTLTLEKRGDENTIRGYTVNIGKSIGIGYQTTYTVESKASIKANPDGTFNSDNLDGSIKQGTINCTFTTDDGRKYTLSAYPKK